MGRENGDRWWETTTHRQASRGSVTASAVRQWTFPGRRFRIARLDTCPESQIKKRDCFAKLCPWALVVPFVDVIADHDLSARVTTVEPLITHTGRWMCQGMGLRRYAK